MVADLQPGEVVIAEKIDRISRLPLPEAERLVASIQAKGARLAVPGVVDLSDLAAEAQGVAKIVLEAVQIMLLRLALQMARDDYEDRRERQRQGIELARQAGQVRGRRADRSAAPRSSRCASPATASPDGRAGRVQCVPGETDMGRGQPGRGGSAARSWRTH
jgi:DNA invertase Pin-like site-specific DNA recombinase